MSTDIVSYSNENSFIETGDHKLEIPAIFQFTSSRSVIMESAGRWIMKNGSRVNIRAARPGDEAPLLEFHKSLSETSIYYRWLTPLPLDRRASPEILARVCAGDNKDEYNLVVELDEGGLMQRPIIALATLAKSFEKGQVEVGVVVADKHQKQGLGTKLLTCLREAAKDRKHQNLTGFIHPENRLMQRICHKLGLELIYLKEDRLVQIVHPLQA